MFCYPSFISLNLKLTSILLLDLRFKDCPAGQSLNLKHYAFLLTIYCVFFVAEYCVLKLTDYCVVLFTDNTLIVSVNLILINLLCHEQK